MEEIKRWIQKRVKRAWNEK